MYLSSGLSKLNSKIQDQSIRIQQTENLRQSSNVQEWSLHNIGLPDP